MTNNLVLGDVISIDLMDEADLLDGAIPTLPVSKTQDGLPLAEDKLYVIDTVSSFRMRYAVAARSEAAAFEAVRQSLPEEFNQTHIGEQIFSSKEVSVEEFAKSKEFASDYNESFKLTMVYKAV